MINTVEVCPEIYSKFLAEWLSDNVHDYIDVVKGHLFNVDTETLAQLICDHLNSK